MIYLVADLIEIAVAIAGVRWWRRRKRRHLALRARVLAWSRAGVSGFGEFRVHPDSPGAIRERVRLGVGGGERQGQGRYLTGGRVLRALASPSGRSTSSRTGVAATGRSTPQPSAWSPLALGIFDFCPVSNEAAAFPQEPSAASSTHGG